MFFTIEEIDGSITRHIQLKAAEAGVYVDPVGLTGDQLAVAKDALRTSLGDNGRLLEVFGPGMSEARGDKSTSKIVVDRKSNPLGDIGGFGATYFEKIGSGPSATFTKRKFPENTQDFMYEIRLITDLTTSERIMRNILEKAFGPFRYMKSANADDGSLTDKVFFIQRGNGLNLSEANLIEWIIPYTVKDLFIVTDSTDGVATGGDIVRENIPQLLTVEMTDKDGNKTDLE